MRIRLLDKIISLFILFSILLIGAPAYTDAASADMLKAKAEAEARGYIFFTTHDEIVAMAKKEGQLRVAIDLKTPNFKPWMSAFKQKYPFVTDIRIEEITGAEAHQRFILEMKSGQVKGWDTAHIPIDFFREYPPYLMKYDILGMAQQGVLKIHPGMVHPVERNMVSVISGMSVIPYNRKLISEDKVPAHWEDFLKPEFKERKFVVDLRPFALAALVPAWGLEKTLDYCQKLAAQRPVWGIGNTRINTVVASGEYALYLASTFNAVKRAMSKDPTGDLNYKIIQPIPTKVVDDAFGILSTADHPYTALLWFEFLASPEGQEIIDKYDPLKASVYTPGSVQEQLTRGKQLSVVNWEHFNKMQEYQAKIVAAFGFPKADVK
jgi:iron(III) transport system substrate-binding protein